MIPVDEYRVALTGWRDAALKRAGGRVLTLDEQKENGRALGEAGLAGPTWPVEYGGVGGGAQHLAAFEEIIGPVGRLLAPRLVTYSICAPTLFEFGNEAQRLEHLPAMLAGSQIWAQLLSEPGAGSDLSSVSTRARRVDGGWLLSGQKVWSSRADVSEFALALVRTGDSGPANRRLGLSMMIVDMSSTGVDIRPLREMTGEAIFNEVFLDDVFVPEVNLVGEEHGGWPVLLGMLKHERDAVGDTNTSNTIYQVRGEELSRRMIGLDERARSELQHDLMRLVARENAHLALVDAVVLARRQQGDQRPFGSLSKVSVSMLAAMAGDLAARIDGMSLRAPSLSESATVAADLLLRAPMAGIAGGTTEIQKNTIARHILMLDQGSERR